MLALLDRPTAIAFLETDGDPVAVAKALSDTARTTKVLAVRGGVLEGRVMTADEVNELAKLPPLDALRARCSAPSQRRSTRSSGCSPRRCRISTGCCRRGSTSSAARKPKAVAEDEPEEEELQEETEEAPAAEASAGAPKRQRKRRPRRPRSLPSQKARSNGRCHRGVDKVFTELGKMSVLELVELKKKIEDEWGITAAAPVAVAAPGAAAPGAGAEAEESRPRSTSC